MLGGDAEDNFKFQISDTRLRRAEVSD